MLVQNGNATTIIKWNTEVVGSNPTRSIFINQGNYGIKSGSFLVVVGQNPLAMECVLLTS
jgi:hypothetical protein